MNAVPTLLRYPIWYFVEIFQFWVKFYPRTLILLSDALALKAAIKNLLAPYRKDRTFVGFFIGIVVRIVYSVGGLLFLVGTFIVLSFAFLIYFSLPLVGFLFAVSISDYFLINILGLFMLAVPFGFYFFNQVIKAPRLDESGYPVQWEYEVFKRLQLNPEGALTAMQNGTFEQFLKERKLAIVDYEITREWVAHRQWQKNAWKYWQDEHYKRFIGTNLGWVSGFLREAKYFTSDITQEANARKVFPWQGLNDVLSRVQTTLLREHHNNVLLVGAPGVGKTSVIYAIAQHMNELGGYRVIEINLAGMLAGSGREGEFERRFTTTMKEFKEGDVILVIEDIDQLLTAGVGQYFFPVLDKGDFPIIATTTNQKLRDVLEVEKTFLNAFEQIRLDEPDVPDVLFILQEKVTGYESRYNILISYQALKATIELAEKYITDRVFPTKALDLLEEACASLASGRFDSSKKDKKQLHMLTAQHIEYVVTELTGVAVGDVGEEESTKLLKLEQLLHQRIIGQDDAVQEISSALRRARSGLVSGGRPIGSFLFLGPTGVGKTQTAKTFSEVYFGSEDKMIRFDMSEFSEFGMIDRFLDRISDDVRKQPFATLLLDEFEKADRKIHNLFLQVFEDGRITDTHGNVVDFRNTIIIATSNAVKPEESFSPELRNRFDGIVQFKQLEQGQIIQIAMLELQALAKRLYEKEIELTFSPTLVEAVAQLGYDPQYGARPLRRAVQDHIENPLADALLKETIQTGDRIYLDWKNNHLFIQHAEDVVEETNSETNESIPAEPKQETTSTTEDIDKVHEGEIIVGEDSSGEEDMIIKSQE